MILDEVSLVTDNGQFFLVDRHTCNMIRLSKTAYEVLCMLKNGENEEVVRIFGKEMVDMITNEIISLKNQKIISDCSCDSYQEAMDSISSLEKNGIMLLEGTFLIAQDCNMACKYCYGGKSGQFGQKGLMSKEMAEKYFRYLLSNNGGYSLQKVGFLGGEPLLNMDVIVHIIELWERWKHGYPDRSVYFTITTNGTLLTPEIIKYLKEKEVMVCISLDGPQNIHDANRVFPNGQGTFERIMEGIDLLRRYEKPFNIRVTVNRQTDPDQLYDFLDEYKFDVAYIMPADYPMLYPETEYQLDLNAYRNLLRKQEEIIRQGCTDIMEGRKDTYHSKELSMTFRGNHCHEMEYPFRCPAGWRLATFSIDGNIYLCQRFAGNEHFCIGNIDEGIDIDKVRKIYTDFLDASKSCDSCLALKVCRRRCFKQKAKADGSFEQIPEELCEVYRSSIISSIALSRELAKHMKKDSGKMKEALLRYNTAHLMEEVNGVRGMENEK